MRLSLLILVLASSNASALDIVLRTEAYPASNIVRLGDIADLRAGDEQLMQKFAQLPLMPGPSSPSPMHVRAQTIRDLLAAQGHDVTRLRFTGAEQVVIKQGQDQPPDAVDTGLDGSQTGFRQLTPRKLRRTTHRPSGPVSTARIEELRTQLTDKLMEHVQTASGEIRPWRVSLSLERRHAERMHQATSPVAIEGGTAPWLGPQRFLVSFPTADGEVRFPVDATVSEAPIVVVARRSLTRGETLTAADVEVMPLPELAKIPAQRTPATNLEELLDHEVMNAIRAGEVVTTDMLAPPMMVRRGDTVTVAAGGGGIRVRVLAKAHVDGRRGEIIEVEAPETKERYTARVVGPRQLAVLSVETESAELAAKKSAEQYR